MTEKLERILPTVQKPARYVGGEYGQTMKDKRSVELRVAFCFPDTYEIGMSNLGMRILYAVMNRMEGVWCERVFAPWGDMEDAMRANGLPLYATGTYRRRYYVKIIRHDRDFQKEVPVFGYLNICLNFFKDSYFSLFYCYN